MSNLTDRLPENSAEYAPPRPLAGDELLPPVEPPSAGFIVQLFVVPAVIVVLIVAVWLMVSWLVHRTRPLDLVQGLEGTGVGRWQKASELADILRNERFADFKRDPAAAAKLATTLKREIEAAGPDGGMDGQSVMLRFFLSRALGEFQVADGMDVLIFAAETNRDPAEQLVRRGAVQAIAMRIHHAREAGDSAAVADPRVEETLLRLATDEDPLIRSETAFALGRIGSPASLEKLEALVGDSHADTRYNAAVALAHQGNPRAIDALAEMLEPAPLASVEEESHAANQVRKRSTILHNSLEAVAALAAKNPNANLTPIVESLRALVAADDETLQKALIPKGAIADAERVLNALQSRQVPTGEAASLESKQP